jgi:hypothetical protein
VKQGSERGVLNEPKFNRYFFYLATENFGGQKQSKVEIFIDC